MALLGAGGQPRGGRAPLYSPCACHPSCFSCSDLPSPRLSQRGTPGSGLALTGEDLPRPGEEGGPHGEVTVGAVGELLGFLRGAHQLLDVLELQGAGRTLQGHVHRGQRRSRKGEFAASWAGTRGSSRKGSSRPGWAGARQDSSSSPRVCPCGVAPR